MQKTDALEITASNYIDRNQSQVIKILCTFFVFSHSSKFAILAYDFTILYPIVQRAYQNHPQKA